uniref:Neur_chan_memb domain-containing protein n=1 Tax=Heterorhabditis bacteriophora TaxID=37862 RepID=A0A1I7XNV8_HETBA
MLQLVVILVSVSIYSCIIIDHDYNVSMDDEQILTKPPKRKEPRNCTRDTAIIDKLLNGTGYNKFRIPKDDGVKVNVEFWIQAITSINEITNDFEVLDRLWTPNSCFINSKFAEIHDSPFNFNYNNQEVQMRWAEHNPDPVATMAPIVLPDFDLIKISPTLVSAPYPAGMWDELHVRLTFERRYIWYFMQAYLPTYLTIFISWISFSLGPKAIPARTMLGVNALLAMIFQFGNIMRNLPRVSYIKAIDVWMLMSMTFVFCSLLELAIIGYKVKNEESAKKRGSYHKKCMETFESSPAGLCRYEKRFMLPMERTSAGWRSICRLKRVSEWPPEKIDKISSFMFPACFALFNIIYWSFYYQKKLNHIAQLHH